ncbi:unnamed protein product [Haemonchus placei]|uniref:Integral membrane protein 2 n=1 Tax=Haemonchus placei TaxID=6290 RepID=A0A0N4X4K6_HAEPC|nr:unnamed protein product [Haemonchus placei]
MLRDQADHPSPPEMRSFNDDLAPESHSPDEEAPLLAPKNRKIPAAALGNSIMILLIIGLLISTITFATLYYRLLGKVMRSYGSFYGWPPLS